MQIAKIAVEAATYAIDKPYSYGVPAGMDVSVGCRVLVPFGRGNRTSEGIVLSMEEGLPNGPLKALRLNLDGAPVISPREIKLSFWMRQRYFCTFYDAIRTVLPAAVWYRYQELWHLRGSTAFPELSGKEAAVCQLLLDGPKELSVLREAYGEGVVTTLRGLEKRGAAAMCRTRRCSWFGWRFRRRTPPRGRRPGKNPRPVCTMRCSSCYSKARPPYMS